MRVITKKAVTDAIKAHAQWKVALSLWLTTFDRASLRYESYQQLKAVWNAASGWNVDRVAASKLRQGSQKGPLDIYIFDIKGTECRILTWINTQTGTIFIKSILSHAEYDKWCKRDVK